MRTALYRYRYYDIDDALLYVGVSLNAVYRLAQHRQDKSWFSDIKTVKLETHDTRTAALDTEREVIRRESPKYNIVHKVSEKWVCPNPYDYRPGENPWQYYERIAYVKRFMPETLIGYEDSSKEFERLSRLNNGWY